MRIRVGLARREPAGFLRIRGNPRDTSARLYFVSVIFDEMETVRETRLFVTILLCALLIGVVAGLRAMTAPAIVSWVAYLGGLDLSGTWLAFFSNLWVRLILTLLALVELVTDQLPSTPSRTVPIQFGARILTGAMSGAAVGAGGGTMVGGLLAGIIGAIIGTFGGRALRAWLATTFGGDRPAALIEDAIAIGGAVLIGVSLP